MAYISLTERARIWNSLDDNLREQVRSGKLSIEEAYKFVVPIGDLELQTAREQYPTRPVEQAAGEIVPEDRPYNSSDALNTGLLRVGGAVDALQMGEGLEIAQGFQRAQDIKSGVRGVEIGSDPTTMRMGETVDGTLWNAANTIIAQPILNLMDTLNAAFQTEEQLAAGEQRAMTFSKGQIEELTKVRNKLAAMPPNTASQAFIESVDAGDYWSAAKNAPAFMYYSTLENAPTMGAAAAITGGTALLTRNPTATVAASRAGSSISALAELGGDFESIVEGYTEEERNDPAKLLEAYQLARRAVAGRAAVEALIPGGGLGKAIPTRVASLVAGQAASESGAEELSAYIRGQDVSTGELAAEALGGGITTIAESGLVARQTLTQRRQEAEQAEALRQQRAEEFEILRSRLNEKTKTNITENIEREARRALQDTRDAEALARGEQLELPIGSDMTADPTANDRVPTIVDMFSGESKAAPAVQRELDRRVPADQMPEETDEAFEIRTQRESAARAQIANRKAIDQTEQDQFDEEQQAALNRRREAEDILRQDKTEEGLRLLAEDQTTLKNERSLLSNADITREAKTILAQELEGVRRQRQGIIRNPKQMEAILKSYERQRLPELVNNIRKRRTARINEARKRAAARENATLELDNEKLRVEQAQKLAAYGPRTEANKERGIPRVESDIDSPNYRGSPTRGIMTDLLPGNQLKAAQTYTAKGDVREREQQDEFEFYSQRYAESQPPRGTQRTLGDLPQATDGDLFGTGNTGFTGQLTDEQRTAEMQRRVEQRRTETRSQRVAREKEETEAKARAAEAITAEIPTVEKAINQEKTRRINLTAKDYGKKEGKAIADIVKQELDNPAVRTEDEVKAAIASRVASWRAANPRPAAAPAPATSPVLEQAKTVKNRIEGREKAKETRAVNKELERAIKAGKTPEEAAEEVTNRRLTPQEDAAARARLGEETNPDARIEYNADSLTGLIWKESTEIRDAYDKIMASNSRTKLADLLGAMLKSDDITPDQKWLANRLRPLVSELGIQLTEGNIGNARWYGAFYPEPNTVELRSVDAETVLHETIHAVTSNLLKSTLASTNPTVKAAAKDLEAVLAIVQQDYKNNPSAPQFTEEFTTLMNSERGPISNIYEMLSYGMTNSDFRTYLEGIKVPGEKKNAWQAFKDFFFAIFRPRTDGQRTALDAVLEATRDLVELQEDSPEINAEATTNIRRNREKERALAREEPAPDFTNPTTRREYYELVVGGKKIGPKILKEVVRSPGKTLLNALTAGAVKHAPTTRALERAQSSSAALTRRADKLIEAIDGSLATKARKEKLDLNKLRADFTALTDEYEKTEEGLTRRALVKELNDKYGRAGRSYLDMRRSIDDLSRAILRERLNDPTPLTEAELSIYSAIKENIGTYYTRIYASTIKDIGDEHARKLLKSYYKIVGGKEGTAVDQKNYQIVKEGIQYIRDHLLFIPDTDVLEDMSMVKLNKLASAWGIPMEGVPNYDKAVTSEERRDYLIQRLAEFADKNQAAKEQQAKSLVEGMLLGAEGNNALVDYYRGSKLDNTIVTERQHVPAPIRKLLGEYEDKFVRGMTTIVRQGEFLARMKALNDIRATEMGGRVLTEDQFRDGGYSPQDWRQITGAAAGALQDMWVRNDLADRIDDSQDVTITLGKAMALMERNPQAPLLGALSWGLTKWQKVAGKLKALALVYNPMNALWNFVGGPVILLSNGNLSIKHTARAMKTALNLVRSQQQGGTHNEEIEKVIRAGITDSAFMGDIKASELEQLREVMEEATKTAGGRAWEATSAFFRTAKRMWKEIYAMADVVWKIANFYAEEEFLTKLRKAQGRNDTPAQIEEDAAWRTNNTNFSYKRVPNILKAGEKLGITYIAPYMYETLRAPLTSFVVGVSDIAAAKTEENPTAARMLASHGTKRALGSILALGGIQALTFATIRGLVEMMGRPDDEDEEWIEDLKALLPNYKSEAEYEYLGRAANGNPVLIELSRGDPFGPATELYATVLGGDPEAIMEKFMSMWINNPFGTTAVQALAGAGSTSTKMEQYAPNVWNGIVEDVNSATEFFNSIAGTEIAGRAAGERVAKVVDVMIPSMATRALDPNNVPPADKPELGVFTYLGMQFPQVDAKKTIEYRAMDFEEARRATRRELYSFLEGSPNLTDEQLLARYTKLQENETEAYEDMSKLYNGMLKLGYEPGQILGQLKEEGLTEADLYAIGSGSWTQGDNGVVSYSGIERNFEDAVKRAGFTEAQKERYKANILRLARLVEGGQIQARE